MSLESTISVKIWFSVNKDEDGDEDKDENKDEESNTKCTFVNIQSY
jgi:hypothetical protein